MLRRVPILFSATLRLQRSPAASCARHLLFDTSKAAALDRMMESGRDCEKLHRAPVSLAAAAAAAAGRLMGRARLVAGQAQGDALICKKGL